MVTGFNVKQSKPEVGFWSGYMEIYPIITRVMFFVLKNDSTIKWWIKNGPDLWDVMWTAIDLLRNMIM